jgi:hypothetical protein
MSLSQVSKLGSPCTSTRGLLARDPPFPAQNPQARPGPPSLPPPPPNSSANGAGGRGQGAGPAHPRILNRYFYFHSHFMNGYIFLYDTIHTYSTQSGLIWKYKYITVGEGTIARKGWGASLLPAPLKGMFCIIKLLQEVSRLAILTRIGHKGILYIMFRHTQTNIYISIEMIYCTTNNIYCFISIMCTYNVQPIITLLLLCFYSLNSHEFI